MDPKDTDGLIIELTKDERQVLEGAIVLEIFRLSDILTYDKEKENLPILRALFAKVTGESCRF